MRRDGSYAAVWCAYIATVVSALHAASGAIGSAAIGNGAIGSTRGAIGQRPSGSPDVVQFEFAPGISTSTPHVLPSCTVANNCVMQCTAHASGNAWQCVDGSGAPITVTQGTGTVVSNVWGQPSLQIFSDANAPSITNANKSVALGAIFAAPHTIIATAYGTNNVSADEYLLKDGTSGTSGIDMRYESGHKCIWSNSGAVPTGVTVGPVAGAGLVNGWSISTCRKAGTGASSVYTARVNGSAVTSSAWPNDPANSTTTLFFGRHSSANLFLGGQNETLTVYSDAKSDTELASDEAQWWGTGPTISKSGHALTFSGSSNTQTWLADSGGFYLPMAQGVPRITSDGFYVEEGNASSGTGNNFATDGLDASSWANVSTPGACTSTVTTNVASGPLSRWKNAAEMDEIVDADASNFCGRGGNFGLPNTYTGHATCSAFLAPGATGTAKNKARLSIVVASGGTGSVDCDLNVQTGTGPGGTSRYSCSTLIGGAPSAATTCRLYVGNATTDTGSIRVSEVQLDSSGWAQSPHVSHSAISLDDLEADSTEVGQWATTGGADEAIFVPDFTWASDEHLVENEYTYELLDLFAGNHLDHRFLIWQYNQGINPSLATRGSGQPTTSTDTIANSDPNIVAGHTYAFKGRWKDCGGGKAQHWIYYNECPAQNPLALTAQERDTCHATTLIGSDLSCAKFGPTTGDWGGWQIGCRYSRQLCMKGHIVRATSWKVP